MTARASQWFSVALLLAAGSAGARPQLPARVSTGASRIIAPPHATSTKRARSRLEPATSLNDRLGIAVAERLLRSDEPLERTRAIERLGSVSTARALQILIDLVDGGGAKSPEERLSAVRALWPRAAQTEARQTLIRLMASPSSRSSSREDALEREVRVSAALALAASQEPAAISVLGKALEEEGPLADAARIAILAHPPSDLSRLLPTRGTGSVMLSRTLGELGDQRAFAVLRGFVRGGSTEVRAAAAVALTRLGDLETVTLARHWLGEKTVPELRLAGAQILALEHTPDWPDAISALLSDPETRSQGLDLALAAPHPKLAATLVERLGSADGDAEQAIAALGRAGGPEAARFLSRELASDEHGSAAAYALALMEGELATEALGRALQRPALRALAARAAVVRRTTLQESVPGLSSALESLASSKDGAERAAGAWGLAVLDESRAVDFLNSKDPVMVRAAARTAWHGRAATVAAARLTRETDALTRAALAVCLVNPPAADGIPTLVITRLLREVPAAAPLAARALAMRDDAALRPVIEDLLENSDAWLRAHTALGLAFSADASALGLLSRSYRFEAAPEVRSALVAALGERPERTRSRTLRLAAALDPDAGVRARARLGLSDGEASASSQGTGSFWLRIAQGTPGATEPRAVALGLSGGLAIPAVSDPGGFLILTGLPQGSVTVRLADAPRSNNAWPQ